MEERRKKERRKQSSIHFNLLCVLIGFDILTKSSPNGIATGSVALFINRGNLFYSVQLDTSLQTVGARITLNKTVTFCRIFLPPSQNDGVAASAVSSRDYQKL